jgi:hypothetical protein
MKLIIFSYLVLVTLLVNHTLASTTEFEKLFKLEYCDQHLILSTQDNIKLPDSNLNPIQRLYRYVKLFCKLELYLTDEDSALVIVPYNRLNLFYNTPVCIQLLKSTEDKNFIFTTAETPKAISQKSYTSSNNSAIKVKIDCYNVSIKQFLANDDTIKYLISQLEYGMLDFPSQKFFAASLQLINTTDYLVNIDYNQQQLPCLFKGNSTCYSRYYLISKLVASDLASYLYQTYNCIKDRVQSYRAKQQIKTTPASESEITTEQTEKIETSDIIIQGQQDISEVMPSSESEITTETIENTETTKEQQDISEVVLSSTSEITTETIENTETTEEQQDISEVVLSSTSEITTETIEDTEITQNQQDISKEVASSVPETTITPAIETPNQYLKAQQLDTPASTSHPAVLNQVITANIDLNTGKIYY